MNFLTLPDRQMNFLTLPDRPDIKGVKIAYQQFTCKRATKCKFNFIIMPGGPGADHNFYLSHVDFYTQFGDVLLFDPRGCGLSEANGEQDYQMETYIDDVEVLRQHFKINENFVLFGGSYGSMAAQGYAIKYGKVLSGLILLNGAPSYEFLDSAWKKLRATGTPEQIAMFQKLCDGDITTDEGMGEYFKVMQDMYFKSARDNSDVFQIYMKTRKKARYHAPACVAGFGKNGFLKQKSFDWRPNLYKIACPTLIIGGADDWINTPDQWEIMHKGISNSELHIVPNASHLVFVDQKGTYFDILERFLIRLAIK